MAPLDEARRLASWGFNVLPAKHGGKAPIVSWAKFQDRRTDPQLGGWFSGGERNYWIATGSISQVLVLDIDNEAAEAHWRNELEAYTDDEGRHILDRTAAVRTRNGHHYYFRLPPNTPVASWSHHKDELSFDVRADGTGVIAPPSVHETGHVYAWVRDPDDGIEDLVPQLRGPSAGGGGGGGGGTTSPRSVLTKLLTKQIPQREGGRNDWFTQVCGHYAKQFRTQEDAYQLHVWQAYDRMEDPHPREEAEKTVRSVWNKEQRKDEDGRSQATEANGYLVPGNSELLTPCLIKQGEQTTETLMQWADFDVRAVGVVESESDPRVYDVVVYRKRQEDQRPDLLPAKTIADPKSLAAWLANHGVSIGPPNAKQLTNVRENTRLLRYIESQTPPHFQTVPALGWWGDEFICHEGVIRADGLHGFNGRKPAVHLRTRARHRYGMAETLEEARRVLNEVLTYHDETVAAVFGSWWAATLLKPLIKAQFSQFPIMAIEAPSESGKTTGMFPMLLELGGSTEGQSLSTKAAMTRNLADHNTGIVWIDDANDLDHLDELLRAVTGDGYIKKMAEDRTNTVVEELVAPVLLSGEALGRSDQKATADRRITLPVPSPVDRRSLKDPTRPQWDDIRALRAQYPELSAIAGTVMQLAAGCTDEIEVVRAASASGRRYQHKLTILLIGARVLTRMTGDKKWATLVGEWVAEHGGEQTSHNTLVEKLLPRALMNLGVPTRPQSGGFNSPPTPAFLAEGVVWFNVPALAVWWEKDQHGRVDPRTETAKSLELQRKAIAAESSDEMRKKVFRLNTDPSGPKAKYWALPDELTDYVVGLVEGDSGMTPRTVSRAVSYPSGADNGASEARDGGGGRLPDWLIQKALELPDEPLLTP